MGHFLIQITSVMELLLFPCKVSLLDSYNTRDGIAFISLQSVTSWFIQYPWWNCFYFLANCHSLGKCAISPVAMAFSISLFVRVSVCYNHYHWSYLSENQYVKNDICRFWYLPSNDVIAKIALHGIDLLFEGKKFEMLISLKWLN